MSSRTKKAGRHAAVIGLTTLVLAASLLGGCTARSAGAPSPSEGNLQAENAQLKARVTALEQEVQRLGAKVAAAQPLQEPMSLNYIGYPHKHRLVLRAGVKLLAMPRDGAIVLASPEPGAVLDIQDAAGVDGNDVWLYAAAPVYSSPTNFKGWVRESDTTLLTSENRSQIRGDLYLKAGTPVYMGLDDFAAIAGAKPVPLDSDQRGWLNRRQGGYADLSLPGGLSVMIEEKYLVYPPVE